MKDVIDLVQQGKKLSSDLYKFYEQKKREWDLLGYNLQILPTHPSHDYNKLPQLNLVKRTQEEQIDLRIEQCVNKFIRQYQVVLFKQFKTFIEKLKQNGFDISFTRVIQMKNLLQCGTETYNITDIDKCIQKLKDTGKCDEVSIYQFMAKLDETGKLQTYVRMYAKSDYPQLTSMVNYQIDDYENHFHVNRAEVHQTYKKFIDLLKYNNIEVEYESAGQHIKLFEGGSMVARTYFLNHMAVPELSNSNFNNIETFEHVVKELVSQNIHKISIFKVRLTRDRDYKGNTYTRCEIIVFKHSKLHLNKYISQKDLDDIGTITHTQSRYKTSKEWYDDMKVTMSVVSEKLKDKFWNVRVGDIVQIDYRSLYGHTYALPVITTTCTTFTVIFDTLKILFNKFDGKMFSVDLPGTWKRYENWKALQIVNRKPNSANWVKMSKDCSKFVQQIARQKNMTVQQVVSKFLGTETQVISVNENNE